MFGLSRQEKIIRKMKKSGVTVIGEITEISQGNIITEFLNQLFCRKNKQETIVHVTYRTSDNTEEEMLMNVKDVSSYHVGSQFTVKYIFLDNHFIAFPENLFKKEK